MTDWEKIIKTIAPNAKPSIVYGLAEAMPEVIKIADLSTPIRQAHFLAQLAHESAGFRTTTEYASGAEYNGRKDLGNTGPNDGVRYKGRGLIQITGRYNYRAMGRALGQDFEGNPDLAAQFPWAALTAAEYWKERNINRYADKDDVKAVTKIINGGYNGLADRDRLLKIAKTAIGNQDGSINVSAAQKRLALLSYPLGAIDGKIGPLTRSAIRDFQDALGEPVTGELDQNTYDILMSDSALKRPVSHERESLTSDDLKSQGSTIVSAADDLKKAAGTAGTALAAASGVAAQVSDVKDKVMTIKDAVDTGHQSVSLIGQYWQLALIAVLLIVLAYCIYRCWKLASVVENERVRQARSGENVRV